MKIFEVPTFGHELSYALSFNGIVSLKQGDYRHRHGGSNILVQVPAIGFDPKLIPDKPKKEKKRKKLKLNVPGQKKDVSPKPIKEKSYKVNKKVVRHKLINYVNQMKGEKFMFFWTVSFMKGTPDKVCWHLLSNWLTRLRNEKMIKEYLWIAERQENGTAHFHMVINRKMDVKKANRFMRTSIISCINSGEIDYDREAALKYNGVDIAKNRTTRRVVNFAKQNKERSLQNYLTKYVTKNDTAFENLAWHNSREYSAILTEVRFTRTELVNSGLGKCVNIAKIFEGEFCTFIPWINGPPGKLRDYLASLNCAIQTQLEQRAEFRKQEKSMLKWWGRDGAVHLENFITEN